MITLDGTLGITSPAETVQGALTTTGNTILGNASTDTLNVGNGGLVKDASGNVGIGTAPSYKLDISGTSVGSAVWAHIGNTDTTVGATGGYFASNGTINSVMYSASNAGYGVYGMTTNHPMTFITNNTEQARISSAGVFSFNSGYGSAATAYGCRAWVNFNGTGTVAIRASGNVSSITDNGTGNYRINFTTAMVDADYCPTATAEDVTSGSFVTGNAVTVPTTSGFTFYVVNAAGALNDTVRVNVGIFR